MLQGLLRRSHRAFSKVQSPCSHPGLRCRFRRRHQSPRAVFELPMSQSLSHHLWKLLHPERPSHLAGFGIILIGRSRNRSTRRTLGRGQARSLGLSQYCTELVLCNAWACKLAKRPLNIRYVQWEAVIILILLPQFRYQHRIPRHHRAIWRPNRRISLLEKEHRSFLAPVRVHLPQPAYLRAIQTPYPKGKLISTYLQYIFIIFFQNLLISFNHY